MYNFNMSKDRKKELLNNCGFDEIEIFIFNELVEGTKRKDIGLKVKEKYNLCYRTTQRKMQKISIKIGNYDLNQQPTHKVYMHKFPDGKRYVGVCQCCKDRWDNGSRYAYNKEMFEAIQKYGWENIEHKILFETSDSYIAYALERVLIDELDLVNNGYNNI